MATLYFNEKKVMEANRKMKKKFSILVLSVFILMLLPAISGSAKKPITGTMALEYNLFWPGYQDVIPDWVGTISFDGVNEEYGMVFFCTGTGKPFEDPERGSAFFFGETYVIYEYVTLHTVFSPEGEFLYQWLEHGDILLWGYDTGATTKNSKYRMNGNVEYDLLFNSVGRNVHMSGLITWQDIGTPEDPIIAPLGAPGTFRIN
jgi:hypothetical protein